jgi:hypothetical protein
MKNIFLLFAAVSFCGVAQSQVEMFYPNKIHQKGDTLFIFNTALLKESANYSSASLAELNMGEPIIIVSDNEGNFDNKPDYYEVSYKDKLGFINSEALSLIKLNYDELTYFLFQMNYHAELEKYELIIREVDKNGSYHDFYIILKDYLFSLHMIGNKGLDGIKALLVIDYIAEACMMESGATYFIWNPKNLDKLFHLSAFHNAGVEYYEESVIFPEDSNGVAGKVIINSEYVEVIDEILETYKEKKEFKIYDWTFGKLVPPFESSIEE